MPAEMAVIERVPIAQVGTWAASTGEWDATRTQFAAAVAASRDPSIRLPRVWIGHDPDRVEGRDTEAGMTVGWASNLALDGDTLYADLHVPPLLADTMHAHFPSRSIEAARDVVAASGQRYELVTEGVALLGRELPAVSTLSDIAELWGMTPPRETVAASETKGSRLIVCALAEGAASSTSTVEPVNQRPEATMADDATDTQAEAVVSTEAAVDETTATTESEAMEATDTTASEVTADAAAASLLPDGFIPVEQAKWDELNAKLALLDDLVADKAEREADEFAGELIAAGKIAASSKAKIVKQYKANPDGTRAICDLLPEGAHQAPPTGRVAATRADDRNADDETGISTRLLTPAQRQRLAERGLTEKGA